MRIVRFKNSFTGQNIKKMEKLTFSQIIKHVQKYYNDSVDDFAYDERRDFKNTGNSFDYECPELGVMKEVEQVGGEGEGDTWYSVKYFQDHDVYIKVSGWYQSYNGTDFGDWNEACKEVRPVEKTITVYE